MRERKKPLNRMARSKKIAGTTTTSGKSPAVLSLTAPHTSVTSLLRTIGQAAWVKYPTRKSGGTSDKVWWFFGVEELREIYSLLSDFSDS
jgi:hypothetical protein